MKQLMSVVRGLFSVLTALFLVVPINLSGQGYHIEVTMKGLSKDTLILGEYFTSRMVPKDTIVLDKNGVELGAFIKGKFVEAKRKSLGDFWTNEKEQ